ncbi:MAG: PLP-dependent aspartate aminotransferase family protein [Spirochaetales bacterium]|nr:PLP-dependent aspartate aminotransferase family protein [Spirochaetales bacterium]
MKQTRFKTTAVHRGVSKDKAYNSVITPLYPSSTFRFKKIGETAGYDYTRSGNPTRSALCENLAALENGQAGYATATGMAAVTAVLHLLKQGDHVIAGNDIYGGTYRLLDTVFRNLGIETDFVDMRHPENVTAALKQETRLIWIETPSNPLMNIVDIREVCRSVKQTSDALICVDNTFPSPYLQQPLELGAHLVVHSTTKYINGHSDVVGGAVITGTQELGDRIAFTINALGIAQAPFDSWLVLRGVKTLALRMEQHQKNARALAEFLSRHPAVQKVYYPGLESHPGHETAGSQMKGFGGMLSFDLDPRRCDMDRLFEALTLYALAESLGGVESLIEAPWHMSHLSMSEEAREAAGISPFNIRVSLGIEDTDDLIADMEQALKAASLL